MAVVGSLIVLLGTNNTALTGGLLKAEGQLKAFGATAGTTGAMSGAALGGVGLVAAAGMALAVGAAKNFQEEMAKVNTIAHLAPEPLAVLGQEVRNLSVATGVGVDDLTSGLYDLFSVGVPAGRAMEFLGNATTLSIGGLSTANEAVLAITTAINAWSGATGAANLTMADSAKVMDIFAQAIAAGGMTAADIPGALAGVAAQAAMMNMPLEEIGAAWSILTVRGLSAAEASTSVAAALSALAKAPPGMEELEKATGKTYLQIAKTQGVHEALMQLVADAQKFDVELQDVFGRKEALPFVAFTTGAGGDALWGQALAAEYNSAGVAAGQMAERMSTLQRQLDIFGASANDLGITLGTTFLPPLTTLVTAINTGVQSVTAWAAANPDLSSSLLPVIAAVGILGAAVALLGLPLVAIGVFIGLVIVNFDNLQRGIQVVIDKINEFIRLAQSVPGVELLGDINRNTGGNINAAEEAYRRNHPELNLPGALPGKSFQPGVGDLGRVLPPPINRGAPTVINHTSNIYIDGQKVTEVVERRLYNDATGFSSGFAPGSSRP